MFADEVGTALEERQRHWGGVLEKILRRGRPARGDKKAWKEY